MKDMTKKKKSIKKKKKYGKKKNKKSLNWVLKDISSCIITLFL